MSWHETPTMKGTEHRTRTESDLLLRLWENGGWHLIIESQPGHREHMNVPGLTLEQAKVFAEKKAAEVG